VFQAQALTRVGHVRRKMELGPRDVFLQKAPVSFDASVQELFNPFACGGMLLLAAPGGEKDTQYLARLCREQRVTCASFVPSQLDVLLQARAAPTVSEGQPPGMLPAYTRVVLQEPEVSACKAMRHVLVGGEALPPALAARFEQRLPHAHLHNAYGPTETTVDATGGGVAGLVCMARLRIMVPQPLQPCRL
jgi:non-ribosomal peptide synthetase component F